jgi:chromosome partitioning protein
MNHLRRLSAKVITVINLKGGVGKTHTAWLLSSVCQERSLRLLAVDTDTQANLSNSLLPDRDGQPGIEALFNPASDQQAHALIRRTRFSHIDAIPAGPALARFDLTDPKAWEQADLHLALQDSVETLRPAYDFIVFDCPPRLSVVSYAALCASDAVVIPLEAADWGAQGIVQVTAAIRQVQAQYNPRLCLLGYLVSRFKRARAYQQSYLKQLRAHFGDLAFDSVIPVEMVA